MPLIAFAILVLSACMPPAVSMDVAHERSAAMRAFDEPGVQALAVAAASRARCRILLRAQCAPLPSVSV